MAYDLKAVTLERFKTPLRRPVIKQDQATSAFIVSQSSPISHSKNNRYTHNSHTQYFGLLSAAFVVLDRCRLR